jgi:hypothetical protein
MAKSETQMSTSISSNLPSIRSSSTDGELSKGLERIRRNQELLDLVDAKNRTDPNLEWSVRLVDGKLRVTVKPK